MMVGQAAASGSPKGSGNDNPSLLLFLLASLLLSHPAFPYRYLVSIPLLAQGMPQFTFACFCGLHGFCKMKRKKEDVHRERETAV